MRDADLNAVLAKVRTTRPEQWAVWPGGWPGEVEAALLDAVLSIRATYGQKHNGVRGAVGRWRATQQGRTLDDLGRLAACDPETLATVLENQQRLSGGSLKSAAVVEAAQNLVNVGVRHAADLRAPTEAHKRAYVSVRGLGSVTWVYLLMLLGIPDVKADTWIMRFVGDALGRSTSPTESRALVNAAAGKLGVSATALDHAIWSHVRRARP